jgi:hypothetical protein
MTSQERAAASFDKLRMAAAANISHPEPVEG